MSRLDQHVERVRNKMALATLVRGMIRSMMALAIAAVIVVMVERLTHFMLPRQEIWVFVGLGIALVVPMVMAWIRRPSAYQAAVAIDERLALKEKFSTALFARSKTDLFAAAAVRDAETAASSVNLGNHFPVRLPRPMAIRLFAALLIAFGTMEWMPQYDVFGHEATKVKFEQQHHQQQVTAERLVKQTLAEIAAAPREVAENEEIKLARQELNKILDQPIADVPKATKRAQDTLKEIDAVKQKIIDANKYATAKNEINNLKDVPAPPPEETGPIADAHRQLAEGKLEEAVTTLQNTVSKFDQMTEKEKEKAAEQMKNLARDISNKANDPKVQEQIKQQLQQAGVNQQMAQQMAQAMQQAANGDQAAAQNLQKMANQAIQQANQQGGLSQQQQQAMAQAIKQAAQQGQQKANGQASAQQMANTAQALANAMKQASGQSGKQGQQASKSPSGQGQQASKSSSGQGQQSGQQSGGQQANAQQQSGGQQSARGSSREVNKALANPGLSKRRPVNPVPRASPVAAGREAKAPSNRCSNKLRISRRWPRTPKLSPPASRARTGKIPDKGVKAPTARASRPVPGKARAANGSRAIRDRIKAAKAARAARPSPPAANVPILSPLHTRCKKNCRRRRPMTAAKFSPAAS